MQIALKDGRVFAGTALQIVRAMQRLGFGVDQFSVSQYAEWVASNALRCDGVALTITGETDEKIAVSLVEEMLKTNLATRVGLSTQ